MTRLTTCADAEGVARRAREEIARLLEGSLSARQSAHFALAGGQTPKRSYELLAVAQLEWADIDVWFIDERCVPPDHEQSNYRMAAHALLDHVAIPAGRVHRMLGELGPEQGARRYAAELEAQMPRASSQQGAIAPPVLDLAVLGIGPEGHIASLFPDAAALQARESELCVGVTDSPKPPPERITLTLPVLRAARRCLLLASGADKADAVAAMLAEPTPHVPASLLRRERLTVIVDDAAGPRDTNR